MGYEYSKVRVENKTAKPWTVTLNWNGGYLTEIVQPKDTRSYEIKDKKIHCLSNVNVRYEGSGMSCASFEKYKYKELIDLEIRATTRQSAELYQCGRGKLDSCKHPDKEGDDREEELEREKAKERKRKEKEIQRKIETERQALDEKYRQAKLSTEQDEGIEVPTRTQHVLKETVNGSVIEIQDDEGTCEIYNSILQSRPVFTQFEESNSLQSRNIEERCGYLINFILGDYCDAHDICFSQQLHSEVLSATRYDEARLREKLILLNALNKSVYNELFFDELEKLEKLTGIELNDRLVLFLRFIRVISHESPSVASNVLLHILDTLPSTHRGISLKLTELEKILLHKLIFNQIWTAYSAIILLSYLNKEDRLYVLHMACTYRINDECILRNQEPQYQAGVVHLFCRRCNSEDVLRLVTLINKKKSRLLGSVESEMDILSSIFQSVDSEVSFENLGLIVSNLNKAIKNMYSAEVLGDLELRLLVEVLICKQPSYTRLNQRQKSIIVVILATIQSFLGHSVDIVMPSERLVQQEVDKWCKLYSQFGFECFDAAITSLESVQKNDTNCVIYGTVSQFEKMENAARRGTKCTSLIIYDLPDQSCRPSRSIETKTDDAERFPRMFKQYLIHYNLSEDTKRYISEDDLNRDFVDSKEIVKATDRAKEVEEDKSFDELLEEIKATYPETTFKKIATIVKQFDQHQKMNMHRTDRAEEVEEDKLVGVGVQLEGIKANIFAVLFQNLFKHTEHQKMSKHRYNSKRLVNKIKHLRIENDSDLADTIMLLSSHLQNFTGFFPRNNQILALVCLCVASRSRTGCLLEMATGEGKSTVVAMFAAIQALHGKTVDIVTSSEVLARRDAEEWNDFYQLLGLSSCAIPVTNILDCKTEEEVDACIQRKYSSKIIYGTTSDFTADILRHEFECRNIRGYPPRQCQVVIVDEVDSMTLDNGLQLTYLSHNTTSLRHMEQLLALIWSLISPYRPIEAGIEESSSCDVLWATAPQYIHTRIAENIVQGTDQLVGKAFDILEQGANIELFCKSDCTEIRRLHESDDKDDKQKFEKKLQEMMAPITTDDQRTLIKSQDFCNIVVKCYKMKTSSIAELIETHSPSTHDEQNEISLLLLEKGLCRELYSKKKLGDLAKKVIDEKIRYSKDVNVAKLKEESGIVLPMYLKEYIEKCFPLFVENALNAILMTKGREYIVADGRDTMVQQDHNFDRVVPIDFDGTGVLEKNKKWADGLQQFLEMKHQLAISPVSTVTNFMSNYHFFQRYSKNCGVYGVTGTLGDKVDHGFLDTHFETKCYFIPPHRWKKLVNHPVVQVETGRNDWMQTICERVKEITKGNSICKGQAVLIVCEDLKTAEDFEKEIENDDNRSKVHMYTRSDVHKDEIEQHTFTSGDIIITTTLGGRGTDYKVDEDVNKSGGLFVLLTFFPQNMRIEKQMIGRTARKGNPGMAQLILDKEALPEAYQGHDIETMHDLRLRYEQERIKHLEENELANVGRRENLFEIFCVELKDFKNRSLELKKQSMFDDKSALNSIKEKWAFWLILNRTEIDDKTKDFSGLREELLRDIRKKVNDTRSGKSNNFYDHALNAMGMMTLLSSGDKETGQCAMERWQALIDTEKVYNAVAFYNQAYITIKLKEKGYSKKALDMLESASTAIQAYTAEMTNTTLCIQVASASGGWKPHHESQTNFNRQQQARGSIIKAWNDAIEKAQKVLRNGDKDYDFKVNPLGLNSAVEAPDDVMEDEMMLMVDMGLTYFFEVEETRKFKFSYDALWCCILGTLQVAAGLMVIGFTLGAATTVGLGLISEGVSDMIDGVIGMITGSFSWAQWAISKAISLATSLLASGLSALKRAAKTAWKGVKTTVSGLKGVVTTTTKSATKQALKANLKLAGKYAGQEIAKQAVIRGSSKLLSEGCTALFKTILRKIFADIVTKNLKKSADLEKRMKFSVESLLPSQTTPSVDDKDKLEKLIKAKCEKALSEVMKSFMILDKIGSQIDQWKSLITAVSSHKSPRAARIITITVEVAQYLRLATELVSSWPSADYVENKIAPALAEEILPNVNDKGNLVLPQHLELEYQKLHNIVCKIVTEKFVETISSLLVSMSQRHACQFVCGKLGTYAANTLDRVNTNNQFADQTHSWDIKLDAEDKPSNEDITEQTRNDVEKLAKEAGDHSKPASDLHLAVLTKEGLLDGKGIIIEVVDDNGKAVTSNHYEGDPEKEPIRLRLKQTKEGKRSFLDKVKGNSSSYSGHYELIQNGEIVQFNQEKNGQNCLFEAIAVANGKDATFAKELRAEVGKKITNNPKKWAPAVRRQNQHDIAYKNPSLFSLKGGASRLKDPLLQDYMKKFDHKKPPLTKEEEKLELGTTDEYNSRAYKSKNVKETEQDHIPPKTCLKGDGTPAGRSLAMTVRKEHHKAALSTGNSRESNACRDLVTELRKTDEKAALYASYIIAHPEASNNIRKWTDLPAKDYGAESTKYYTGGLIDHAAMTSYGNTDSTAGNRLTGQDMPNTITFITEGMFQRDNPIVQKLIDAIRVKR